MEITLQIEASGDFTDQELRDYIIYLMGFGMLSYSNPFLNEDRDAELIDVEVL